MISINLKKKESISFGFKAVKDYRLFLIVGILFAIDTVLLTSWQIADPLQIFKDISQTQVDRI